MITLRYRLSLAIAAWPLLISPVAAHNLTLEFHTQAPQHQWDTIHEDLCEEASLQVVLNYFNHQTVTDRQFDQQILKLRRQEIASLWHWRSTSVREIQRLVKIFHPRFTTRILENPTATDLQLEIDQSHPVLLPLAGRQLKNPYYTPPGPRYHWLVVTGYDDTGFITQDVGTKRGANYHYPTRRLISAIHDWTSGDLTMAPARALVIYLEK